MCCSVGQKIAAKSGSPTHLGSSPDSTMTGSEIHSVHSASDESIGSVFPDTCLDPSPLSSPESMPYACTSWLPSHRVPSQILGDDRPCFMSPLTASNMDTIQNVDFAKTFDGATVGQEFFWSGPRKCERL